MCKMSAFEVFPRDMSNGVIVIVRFEQLKHLIPKVLKRRDHALIVMIMIPEKRRASRIGI